MIHMSALFLFFLLFNHNFTFCYGITNGGALQLGDSMAPWALAKILSWKYDIPFYLSKCRHMDIFAFYGREREVDYTAFKEIILVKTERDIIDNLHKENVLFYTDLRTYIERIDQVEIDNLKLELKPSSLPILNDIPHEAITIAVHIRKGNGGGEFIDGESTSLQEFNFDRFKVAYLQDYFNYPFDWEEYRRDRIKGSPSNPYNHVIDRIWMTKFPPNQFYIDQIKKLYSDLGEQPLYIQIFTDDNDPHTLLTTIENAVNIPSITFYFHNNRKESIEHRMIEDLCNMARFDILIRSQSYFARLAELMGNHYKVLYPLSGHWEDNKLIMDTIVMKKIKEIKK